MMKKREDEPTLLRGELSIKQLKFIEAMLAGASIRTAAQSAGVTARTGHNWLLLDQVKVAIANGTEALLTSARERIELLSIAAIDTRQEIMNDPESPAGVRVQAARALAAKRLEVLPAAPTIERPLDFSMFTDEEFAVLAPIFEKASEREKKQA